MRAVLVGLLLGVATPAGACPHGTACMVTEVRVAAAATPREQVAATPIAPLPVRDALAESLRMHVVPRPGDVAMPWIWQVLSRDVYEQMPRYEKRRFTIVLSPVIVEGSHDTVPGVGLGGDF